MRLGFALVVLLTLAACGSSTSSRVSSAPRASASAIPTYSSPASNARQSTPQSFSTELTCAHQPVPGNRLVLFRNVYDSQMPLGVLDVSVPTAPVLDCALSPAQGGRFLSATKIAFWIEDYLGVADLATGVVSQTARLPAAAQNGAFSADGTAFAYRVLDDAGGVTGHLFMHGTDRTIYSQEPMGGHGGPGPDFGPYDQVSFSADGTEFVDYMLFRPPSGPSNLAVYHLDGSLAFELGGSIGVWGATGHSLYFTVPSSSSQTIKELDQLDFNGLQHSVSSRLNGYWWPVLSPDGASIVYNVADNSVPDCGGLQHLWSVDLQTGNTTQLSKAVSSTPAFVGPKTVWSNEEQLGPCGLGGPSVQTGMILAHDLNTGADSRVDLSFYRDLTGSPAQYVTAAWVLDIR